MRSHKSEAHHNRPKNDAQLVLSARGAIFINGITHKEKMNTGCSYAQIREPLAQILHTGQAASFARPIPTFGNATPHQSAEVNKCIERCQFPHHFQLSYIHQISSYDIYLFDELKKKSKVKNFRQSTSCK
jgi:hypothetical protein